MLVEDATCSLLMSRRGGGTSAVRPDLATGLPRISADRRSYSFTVRRGMRFAPPSNAPVTAEDVRPSIERALSSQLGSHAPGIRYLAAIVGARELNRGT